MRQGNLEIDVAILKGFPDHSVPVTQRLAVCLFENPSCGLIGLVEPFLRTLLEMRNHRNARLLEFREIVVDHGAGMRIKGLRVNGTILLFQKFPELKDEPL